MTPEEAAKTDSASLADQKWWEVFQDKELQELIRTALQKNYDARIAAARVLEAQAQLGITRANQFPSLSGGANITNMRDAASGPIPAFEVTQGQVSATAAWNLDFWGQVSAGHREKQGRICCERVGAPEVIATLVANVASGYFQLRELDLELEISQRTLDSRKRCPGIDAATHRTRN